MKNHIIYFYFALLLVTGACSTDFDLTSEYKEIPIAFALFNQNDSIHFVRIQKAFLLEGNALEASQINDSIYYPDILDVRVKDMVTFQEFILERVDGRDYGLVKDPGVFSDSPNVLYRMIADLNGEHDYQINIANTESGKTTSARVNLILPFAITVPREEQILSFADSLPINLRWQSAENGKIYDLEVAFHFNQWHVDNPSAKQSRKVTWAPFRNFSSPDANGGTTLRVPVNPLGLLRTIRNEVNESADTIRELDPVKGMEFTYIAGGVELWNYVRVQTAQSGLSSNEALPDFTNFSNDALGLFSSRYDQTVERVFMTDRSLDTLACGSITGKLNFRNSRGTLFCN